MKSDLPLKIAFDYQTFHKQVYGGISKYFVSLVSELSILEQRPKIFAPFYVNRYARDLPKKFVFGIGVNTKKAYFISRRISNMAIKQWKPDLIHETYYDKGNSTKTSAPPVVITVYDMIHELFPSHTGNSQAFIDLKKNAIHRADHIICISQSTRRDLIELLNISEHKISVVHLASTLPPAIPEMGYSTLKSSKPFLLYVGMRQGCKNFSTLLKALSLSKKLQSDFDLLAFGGGAFTADELDLMSKLNLKPGSIKQVSGDDDQLNQFYSQAEAFICPSLYEGFGLPLLEAAANNCPVVTSNKSSMPEVMGEAAHYFEPTSADDIMNAIESVVYNGARKSQLRQLGLSRAAQFSWAKCAAETLGVYRHVVERR
jgi:glycosyltransferase involved in cell wall biosynthesis